MQPAIEAPERRPGAVVLLGLAVTLIALGLFVWLGSEMGEGETRQFDDTVRNLVHSRATPALTALFRLLSLIGTPFVIAPAAILAVVLFHQARWRRGAMLLVVSMAGAGLLEAVLKLTYRRARPLPFFDTPLPASFSFPSGHAMFSVCFYCTLALLIADRVRSRRARVALWAVAILLAIGIGVSRIYLGVHYPTDVIGGYTIAAVWVTALISADHVRRFYSSASSTRSGTRPQTTRTRR